LPAEHFGGYPQIFFVWSAKCLIFWLPVDKASYPPLKLPLRPMLIWSLGSNYWRWVLVKTSRTQPPRTHWRFHVTHQETHANKETAALNSEDPKAFPWPGDDSGPRAH